MDLTKSKLKGRFCDILCFFCRNLLGSSYTETRYSEDGKRVTTSPDEEVFILTLDQFIRYETVSD